MDNLRSRLHRIYCYQEKKLRDGSPSTPAIPMGCPVMTCSTRLDEVLTHHKVSGKGMVGVVYQQLLWQHCRTGDSSAGCIDGVFLPEFGIS